MQQDKTRAEIKYTCKSAILPADLTEGKWHRILGMLLLIYPMKTCPSTVVLRDCVTLAQNIGDDILRDSHKAICIEFFVKITRALFIPDASLMAGQERKSEESNLTAPNIIVV